MDTGSRLDAGTAQIYALDFTVLSDLEAKWFEDTKNSPRRAGPSFHPYMLHICIHYAEEDSKSKSVLPKMLANWNDAKIVEFMNFL